MLNAAGAHLELETAQWLRQQGAEWPATLLYTDQYEEQPAPHVWRDFVLKWASDQGCTSPTINNVLQPANAQQ
jgi:hypothetical protein